MGTTSPPEEIYIQAKPPPRPSRRIWARPRNILGTRRESFGRKNLFAESFGRKNLLEGRKEGRKGMSSVILLSIHFSLVSLCLSISVCVFSAALQRNADLEY